MLPHEIGVFVRSSDQVQRAASAVKSAALSPRVLDERVDVRPGSVNVATMHLAKGLEFRVVAVMACDDEVLPLQARIIVPSVSTPRFWPTDLASLTGLPAARLRAWM